MHWTERLHTAYYQVPDFHRLGILGKVVDKVLAKLLKKLMDISLPRYYQDSAHQFVLQAHLKRKQKIICSLTSFPARIEKVWIVIESLMRQTVPPDKIILWLSVDQFPEKKVPESLLKMSSRGLEIAFCEVDMKAHKKYLYALTQYPNDWIITFDDDLYYDSYSIENLLLLKKKYPDAIVTNRAHQMRLSEDGEKVKSYRKWKHNVVYDKPSKSIIATGGCGTLYETKLLHDDFSDEKKIKQLSNHADDIWLKMMAHLRGTKVVTNNLYGKDPIVIGDTQQEKLVTTNVLSGGNDHQLQALMDYYAIQAFDFRD